MKILQATGQSSRKWKTQSFQKSIILKQNLKTKPTQAKKRNAQHDKTFYSNIHGTIINKCNFKIHYLFVFLSHK